MINQEKIFREINLHFSINNKLIGQYNKKNKPTHFFNQKFTYDSIYLVSNIIKELLNNKNNIYKNEIEDFFDKFLNYGNKRNIFLKENSSKKSSINDQKTWLKEGLDILLSSKIIEKDKNQYNIINYSLINDIAISDINISIYFMKTYFKTLLMELGIYNDVYRSIERCISEGVTRHKFENGTNLENIQSKKQLCDLFNKSLADKFIIEKYSEKNATRIFNKPIQYITFFIQDDYKIDEKYFWFKKEKLSYVKKFALRPDEFISLLQEIFEKQFHNSNTYNKIMDWISSYDDELPSNDNNKKIIESVSEMISNPTNNKYATKALVTEILSMQKSRIGQQKFRKGLFEIYPHKCILSNTYINEILIASHIVSWKNANSDDRLNPHNGLLLNSSIDKLFDNHLISFNQDGELFYSNKLITMYPNYIELLKKIGIESDYLYDKKSIFSEIDRIHHDEIKKFLLIHFNETKENN